MWIVLDFTRVASNNIETAEHMGTHMDAPYHFYEQGWTIDNIPFSKLHGPGVVIDIKKKAAANRDAEVSQTWRHLARFK